MPVGKGDNNLDCFRIYEAAAMGAIPVIVGSASFCTFYFSIARLVPPFLTIIIVTAILYHHHIMCDTIFQTDLNDKLATVLTYYYYYYYYYYYF